MMGSSRQVEGTSECWSSLSTFSPLYASGSLSLGFLDTLLCLPAFWLEESVTADVSYLFGLCMHSWDSSQVLELV